MNKFLLMAGLAAVLTTGLMGDKCTFAPQQEQTKPDAPATTEPAPAPKLQSQLNNFDIVVFWLSCFGGWAIILFFVYCLGWPQP